METTATAQCGTQKSFVRLSQVFWGPVLCCNEISLFKSLSCDLIVRLDTVVSFLLYWLRIYCLSGGTYFQSVLFQDIMSRHQSGAAEHLTIREWQTSVIPCHTGGILVTSLRA